MFGIEWQDPYRLKLTDDNKQGQHVNQAISQTTKITAYTIYHQPWFRFPYTVNIIDTPGFGDTGGIKRDQEIMEQIRRFFMTKGSQGIDHLDAVGFVAQSALPRLTPVQRYVFDSILSIFGKDIAENIFMLLTFADGQKPQILCGLEEANMTYKQFYKFNNSALYVNGKEENDQDSDDVDSDDDDEISFDEMFWKMGAENFNKFLTDLYSVEPKSLVLTAEVLKERSELQVAMEGIHENIKMGLKKLEQLKIERQILKSHQSDIDKNRNFTYEVEEAELKAESHSPGQFSTNCTRCIVTCHNFCSTPVFRTVRFCSVINLKGDCRVCPGTCSWKLHENQPFRYVMEIKKKTKTAQDLKKKYEEAEGRKLNAKQLIKKCVEEFDDVEAATLQLTERVRKCLARLNEIALKPNPLLTTDYIDMMMQEEEFIKGPRWKETVNQLEEVKKRAKDMKSLTDEGFDPFTGYKKEEQNLDEVKRLYKNANRSENDGEKKPTNLYKKHSCVGHSQIL